MKHLRMLVSAHLACKLLQIVFWIECFLLITPDLLFRIFCRELSNIL